MRDEGSQDSRGEGTPLTDAQQQECDELDELLSQLYLWRERARREGPSRFGMLDPWPLFIRKMLCLTPQSYGERLQTYLARALQLTRVPASRSAGDAVDASGRSYELKATVITPSNPDANFVQLRPHHQVDEYRLFVVDRDLQLWSFRLTGAQMRAEIRSHGDQLSHGTRAEASANTHHEYSVRFSWRPDDPTRQRWCRRYLTTNPV